MIMDAVLCIIAIFAVGCYFGVFELPVALAPAGMCNPVGRRYRTASVALCMAAGLLASPAPESLPDAAAGTLPVVAGAALLAVAICRAVSPYSSLVFALVGASAGSALAVSGDASDFVGVVIGWPVATVVCAALAFVIYKLSSQLVAHADMHFIRMTSILGLVAVPCTALLLVAAGLNAGLVVSPAVRSAFAGGSTVIVTVAAVVVCAVFVRTDASNRIARLTECEFDVGIVSSQSVVLATALTLLLFTFDGAVSAVGLRAVPLSPAMLALSALAGVGLGQGRHNVEPSTVIRLVTTMFITPAVALLFGYFAEIVFSPATLAFTSETFVVVLGMSVAVAVIFLVSNYLRHSLRSRMSERMLREQGQQLSENRRTLNELEIRNMQIENRNLHDLLELKRREVMSIALNINEQKEFMEGLYEKIKAVQAESSPAERQRMLADIQTSLGQRMNFSNEIDNFYTEVEKLHKDFSIRLTEKFPKLTDSERRLTTLLRLGFSTKYIATLMNISPKSVEIGRHRLRAKLGLDRQQNLVAFVKTI